MFIKFLLFILLLSSLNASTILQETYYVKSNDINISSIIKNPKFDKTFFKIPSNKYSKRIKSKLLIKLLQQNGYKKLKAQSNYINFIKESNIDTSKIKQSLWRYYKRSYKNIDIISIKVQPRGYIKKQPKNFTVDVRKRNYLYNHGIVSIKTEDKKKFFFNYTIKAKILVYIATKRLQKGTKISHFDTKAKKVFLEKLRAKPIQHIAKNSLQARYHINKGKILTIQNTERLNIIKRGSIVNVILHDNGIDISFEAKALKNARLGDTLNVEKSNKIKLKVKAIGINKTEMY